MSARSTLTGLEASASDRRLSQMRTLCHFLDVFASGDPVLRAGAARYGERLREEGCDGEEIIRIAATALLVVIEHEVEQRARVLDRLPALWRDSPAEEP